MNHVYLVHFEPLEQEDVSGEDYDSECETSSTISGVSEEDDVSEEDFDSGCETSSVISGISTTSTILIEPEAEEAEDAIIDEALALVEEAYNEIASMVQEGQAIMHHMEFTTWNFNPPYTCQPVYQCPGTSHPISG